jgi:hypothetical protein
MISNGDDEEALDVHVEHQAHSCRDEEVKKKEKRFIGGMHSMSTHVMRNNKIKFQLIGSTRQASKQLRRKRALN